MKVLTGAIGDLRVVAFKMEIRDCGLRERGEGIGERGEGIGDRGEGIGG